MFTNYIHNAHLRLILSYRNFRVYVLFYGCQVDLYIRGLKYWKTIQNGEDRAVFLAMTLAFIGIFAAAMVNPVFQQWFWTLRYLGS